MNHLKHIRVIALLTVFLVILVAVAALYRNSYLSACGRRATTEKKSFLDTPIKTWLVTPIFKKEK